MIRKLGGSSSAIVSCSLDIFSSKGHVSLRNDTLKKSIKNKDSQVLEEIFFDVLWCLVQCSFINIRPFKNKIKQK